MTRTQTAILPGMLGAFWLGKTGSSFGVNNIVFLLLMLSVIAINLFFERRKK